MSLHETLASFGPDTLTWRLVQGVVARIPKVPALTHYATVADACRALHPEGSAGVAAAAQARATSEPLEALVWMGRLIDSTDATRPYGFGGEHDLDTQAEDAVLKALAIGWLAHRVGSGGVDERARSFRSLPGGRAIMAWWAAIDVALPLAGAELDSLLQERGERQLSRFASLCGDHPIDGSWPTAQALMPSLQKVVDLATTRSEGIAKTGAAYVPGLLPRAAGAEEAVAARADRMPAYTLLAARLAAEAAATG